MKPRALITGASRGIGAAIAQALARDGFPVILNYLSNHEAAQALKAKIEAAGGQAELLPFDVASAEESGKAMERLLAEDEARPIGVLVNNAGITRDNSFPVMERPDWEAVTRCTLDGFFNVTRPLVMPMVRRRFGRIVNISSVSGVRGNRGQVNYSAAKAGLIGATRALAEEVARRGVTVNCVAPGLIEQSLPRGGTARARHRQPACCDGTAPRPAPRHP